MTSPLPNGVRPIKHVIAAAVVAAMLTAAPSAAAPVPTKSRPVGCNTDGCERRVQVRVAHEKWRAVVAAYGIGRLDARMRCESGGHGGYRLSTTGNGFWFSMQWEPRAWYGAGGRQRGGLPVGAWTRQPSRLEQRYRAVVWERRHGGDPWPNCP